jgi:DNA-binding NarL/FixJ family response regulator
MKGGKLGRKIGSSENDSSFMMKPKTREIISLLKKGKSTRDICGRLNVSPNLVTKVRKILNDWKKNDDSYSMVM